MFKTFFLPFNKNPIGRIRDMILREHAAFIKVYNEIQTDANAEALVKKYDDQSFLNIVTFHDYELRRILRGDLISDVLDDSDRKKLRKHGVLGYGGMEWYITRKAKKALRAHGGFFSMEDVETALTLNESLQHVFIRGIGHGLGIKEGNEHLFLEAIEPFLESLR